jgi:hypothetical protein
MNVENEAGRGSGEEGGGRRRRFLLGLLALPGLIAGGLPRLSPVPERTATLSLREADYYHPHGQGG